MSSPKHLWSGDWERESAAVSEEMGRRPRRAPSERPPEPPVTPETVKRGPAPPDEPRPARRPPALRRPAIPRIRPAAAIALAALVILVAAGYGLSRVVGGSSSAQPTSMSANQGGGPIDWLGMQIEAVPPGTVVIATVGPGSAAELAGLEPGDVLMAVNGRPINGTSDIRAAISGLHPGDGVDIQVSRGSTQLSTRAMLGAPPSNHP